MAQSDSKFILIRCSQPECASLQPQTAQFNRTELKKELADNKDIRVFGTICGHSWNLSESEKNNISKALADGAI